MSDLEKMSLVELRVAGRKMGVKNVTTYKKRELLELLLEVEKKQSSNATESAVDNAENASADVKIKKTENRKKEGKMIFRLQNMIMWLNRQEQQSQI